jgi:probable F420-dependent oxidoreductase
MRFSLGIFPYQDPGTPDPFRKTFELCQLAEELGFEMAVIGHHHFMKDFMTNPFVFLSAVAARTTKLRLGTSVFVLPLHHPLEVAEQVAILDQVSNGRAVLGVGSGWSPLEYAAFGGSLRERGARMEESLTIIRRAWTQETVSHQGRFWSFPELPLLPRPVQKPHPPIYVGAVAPRAIDRAARLGDAWIWDPVQTLSQGKALLQQYRDACARHGRRPEWVMRRYAWLGASRQEVAEKWLPDFVEYNLVHWRESTEGEEERRLFARLDAGEAVSPEEIAGERFFWGTPDDCIESIERYRRETGCDHLSIGFGGGTMTRPDSLRTAEAYRELMDMVRLFGREVIPAFKDAT